MTRCLTKKLHNFQVDVTKPKTLAVVMLPLIIRSYKTKKWPGQNLLSQIGKMSDREKIYTTFLSKFPSYIQTIPPLDEY